MSRTVAAANPSKANRRFVMLAIVLGMLGAILVYVTFSRDSATDGVSSVPTAPAVVAKENIPARTRITQSMLDVALVPEDTRSVLGYSDPALVVGQVTRFPIAKSEQVLSSKIVPLQGAAAGARSLSYVIPAGKRAMSVSVSEVVNAGGLVLPGDYVDILIIYDVRFPQETASNYYTHYILQNIEVLAVSQGIVDVVGEATPTADSQGHRVRNSEGAPAPEAATVTLALTPEQAQTLYIAEANGRIRMAVRPYGDAAERPIEGQIQLDLVPRNLPNPFTR
jgi:pilus assembly protein CpaB